MKNNNKNFAFNLFQLDLMKNKYHFYNPENVKVKNYYPKELLHLIKQTPTPNNNTKIDIGEIYSVRAFFAISNPIDNEVAFESRYLDLKLILKENNSYIGEIVTILPEYFALKKGSKVKFTRENIIYKPDYKSKKVNLEFQLILVKLKFLV